VPGGEAFQVDRLAAESRALGGPGKVSIVALGAGGLIARYYLGRAAPDALGTKYSGCVDKVILVGCPHQGARFGPVAEELRRKRWWMRPFLTANTRAALDAMDSGFETLLYRVLDEMPSDTCPPLSLKALGVLQSTHRSFLLRWLNRPERAPKDVRFYCLAGSLKLNFLMPFRAGNFVWDMQFGDLLMDVESAITVPGAKPVVSIFDREYDVDLTQPHEQTDPLDWVGGDLPPVAHTQLMRSREVQQTILDILTAD
jgi:pimeloyl-ACP methyl ester carboxylesterase